MQVFIYDENGFYLDSKFVSELGKNMTTEPILVGRVKPKFDTKLNEWIEGATEEEITDWKNKQPVSEPTEIQQLRSEIDFGKMVRQSQQAEIDYLKLRLEA